MSRPEYEIALQQLDRLNEISRDRLLTTDEVRMYDMLVKNLRLIEEDPTVIEGTSKKSEALSVEDALALMMPPEGVLDVVEPKQTRKSNAKKVSKAKDPAGQKSKPKAD